ncbi:hypothetical protein [Bifidobacterium goeldii]|nr:hypothetical protein [Bifidobacterium goeldii]
MRKATRGFLIWITDDGWREEVPMNVEFAESDDESMDWSALFAGLAA